MSASNELNRILVDAVIVNSGDIFAKVAATDILTSICDEKVADQVRSKVGSSRLEVVCENGYKPEVAVATPTVFHDVLAAEMTPVGSTELPNLLPSLPQAVADVRQALDQESQLFGTVGETALSRGLVLATFDPSLSVDDPPATRAAANLEQIAQVLESNWTIAGYQDMIRSLVTDQIYEMNVGDPVWANDSLVHEALARRYTEENFGFRAIFRELDEAADTVSDEDGSGAGAWVVVGIVAGVLALAGLLYLSTKAADRMPPSSKPETDGIFYRRAPEN